MPATVTLSSTTLAAALSASERRLKLASTAGVVPGYRLWLAEGKELVTVVALLPATGWVEVQRGMDATAAVPHVGGSTVYIGQAHQFYSSDPVGRPLEAIPVSPYINVRNGKIWLAQGDVLPIGLGDRWWQEQTTVYDVGALGVRTKTLNPTSST